MASNPYRSKEDRERDLIDDLDGETQRRYEELVAIDNAAVAALPGDLADDDTRIDARTRWIDGEGEVLAWA